MAENSQYRKSTRRARENAKKYNQKVYGYSVPEMPKNLSSKEQDEFVRNHLLKEYKRLAKVADQRLVRLESYKHDKGFMNVQKFAYNTAMYAIHSFAGDKAKRFNLKIGEDVSNNQIRKRLNDVLTFINSPTSTKQGIIKTYKKRADTLSKTFGAQWTWEELAKLSQQGVFDKQGFGYKTMLTVLAQYDTMNNKKQ